MTKLLTIVFVSTLVTVLFVGFANFSPLPNIGDKPTDCCDQYIYKNRRGFIVVLREDKSGGFAGLRPQTEYHIGNYIKLAAVAFVGTTIVQLVVTSRKKRSATR